MWSFGRAAALGVALAGMMYGRWRRLRRPHTDVHHKIEIARSASTGLFSLCGSRRQSGLARRHLRTGGRHQSMSNSLCTFENVLLVRSPLFTKLLTVMVLLPGSFISKSLVKSPCNQEQWNSVCSILCALAAHARKCDLRILRNRPPFLST
jgi:hypothetical protein